MLYKRIELGRVTNIECVCRSDVRVGRKPLSRITSNNGEYLVLAELERMPVGTPIFRRGKDIYLGITSANAGGYPMLKPPSRSEQRNELIDLPGVQERLISGALFVLLVLSVIGLLLLLNAPQSM